MPDRSLTRRLPAPTSRRRRAIGAAVLAGGLTLAGAACSPTSTESTTSTSTTASSDPGPTTVGSSVDSAASSYETIAGLHQAIVDAGFACTLEYPGLKDDTSQNEVSICTIEDEQAFLTIWADPASLADFASSADGATGTVAIGADWTISVTTPELAGRLASALGGAAPGA
jgi:hypothetical protein